MGDLLRDVLEDDIAVFFEQQNDPEAVRMAVWVPRERDAFYEHWHRILADDDLVAKTIVSGDEVAGNITSWSRDGKRLVGYWLGREFWGQGLATQALRGARRRAGTAALRGGRDHEHRLDPGAREVRVPGRRQRNRAGRDVRARSSSS